MRRARTRSVVRTRLFVATILIALTTLAGTVVAHDDLRIACRLVCGGTIRPFRFRADNRSGATQNGRPDQKRKTLFVIHSDLFSVFYLCRDLTSTGGAPERPTDLSREPRTYSHHPQRLSIIFLACSP